MQRRRILLLTGKPKARQPIVEGLEASGHTVQVSGAPASDPPPDLVIVDLVNEDRWEQASLYSTGRLVLLVADAADLRRGFELGADDCVTPLASTEEVVARCQASLRRTARGGGSAAGAAAIYADSRVWVNFQLRQVWAGGRSAHLTSREHSLLRFLIEHADRPVSADAILRHVWQRQGMERSDEVLKQYIWRLRQKLEPNPNRPQVIVTVPGAGYRFVRHPS